MKELAQTFLIGGGIIGLLPAVPISGYAWLMHRGFGGDLTSQDRLMLYAPFICTAAIVLGFGWRKLGGKKEPLPEPTPLKRRGSS